MNATNTVLLRFAGESVEVGKGKPLTAGLSAVVQIRDSLWVANDESLSLERLSLVSTPPGGQRLAADHAQFRLENYLSLPVPVSVKHEEADIEGLAFDGEYLWLIGSHSLKRKNPKPSDEAEKARTKLSTLEGDGNRYVLARIPVADDGGTPVLQREIAGAGGTRMAARLKGDQWGSELLDVLRHDAHLAPFLPVPPESETGAWKGIPGKDNGFDVEGLAVAHGSLFIGLRGPVLRGWSVILELEAEAVAGNSTELCLKPIGPNGRCYRKHLLRLDGLGVRDLCVNGDDLLILAGPTMTLDGPVAVFRWRGGARPGDEMTVGSGTGQPGLGIASRTGRRPGGRPVFVRGR